MHLIGHEDGNDIEIGQTVQDNTIETWRKKKVVYSKIFSIGLLSTEKTKKKNNPLSNQLWQLFSNNHLI